MSRGVGGFGSCGAVGVIFVDLGLVLAMIVQWVPTTVGMVVPAGADQQPRDLSAERL